MKFKKTKIFLFFILIVGVVFFLTVTKGLKEGKEIKINNVDISQLKDGIYTGKYSKDRWTSEVEVLIKGSKIQDIKLLSDKLTPDVSDELFEKIIDTQEINVDVVSGATVTSKAYLKSVENALNK